MADPRPLAPTSHAQGHLPAGRRATWILQQTALRRVRRGAPQYRLLDRRPLHFGQATQLQSARRRRALASLRLHSRPRCAGGRSTRAVPARRTTQPRIQAAPTRLLRARAQELLIPSLERPRAQARPIRWPLSAQTPHTQTSPRVSLLTARALAACGRRRTLRHATWTRPQTVQLPVRLAARTWPRRFLRATATVLRTVRLIALLAVP